MRIRIPPGECWSGNEAGVNYRRDGASTSCVNGTYKECTNNELCAGEEHTNYIYRIKVNEFYTIVEDNI